MAVNLIKNGDFEETLTDKAIINNMIPPGWSLSHGWGPDLITDSNEISPLIHSDGNFIELDGSGAGWTLNSAIYQDIEVTPGKEYLLSFEWHPFPPYTEGYPYQWDKWNTDEFTVFVDDVEIFKYEGSDNVVAPGWRKESFRVETSDNTIQIRLSTPYGEGDAHGAFLDNISLVEAPVPVIRNLLINGDFEATRVNASTAGPNFNTLTGEGYIIGHTPQGWSLVYGLGVDLLNDVHSKFGAHKTPYGQYVELDGRNNTGISQSVSTIPGKTYRLSFDWALPSYADAKYNFPDYSSKFDVVADGKVVYSYDGTHGTRNAWTHQDIFFTASSSDTTIQFLEKGTSDAEGTLLDNISLVEAPVIRGNSLYTIVDGPSWTQAEANSVKLGGHLVTLNSAEENKWVANEFNQYQAPYIGLTDEGQEGDWEWISGERLVWENWALGAPNGGQSENHSMMYPTHPDGMGVWDDFRNTDPWGEPGIAEIPFIRRGDSAYVIVEGPTWEEAEANANALGGHLVTINDEAENKLLIESGYKGWIGLTDKRIEGEWEWSSGDAFTLDDWIAPIFNGDDGPPVGQDYVYFDDAHEGPVQWDSVDNSQVQSYGIAEIKLAPNNAPTGNPKISGDLKVGSTLTIDATTIQDVDNHEYWTPTYQYSWEIANDPGLRQVPVLWEALTTADATDGNETLEITDDLTGKLIRGVVSYLDGYGTNEVVNSDASVAIEKEYQLPVIRGNSLYTIVDGPSWTEAEANAVKLGGHLVTVNTREENKWLGDKADAFNQKYSGKENWELNAWIGLNDVEVEGAWKWSSGETFDFQAWGPGSPSSYVLPDKYDYPLEDRTEDYVHIIKAPEGAYNHEAGVHWNNTYLEAHITYDQQIPELNGIAETPFIRRGDSAYVIVEGPTWEEAEANANALGGHLVTINDAEENEWLIYNYSSFYLNLWIGATDREREGDWRWISGEDFEYTNWTRYEPNNTYSTAERQTSEDFGHIKLSTNLGQWNDLPNKGFDDPSQWHFIDSGIAEIKLAPNNSPTGTPTISGDLKVGSKLTIDASTIQDADNHEYWTPIYKYSWEVADDPGMTMMMPIWESLDTPDATDGDENLEITDDLTGKLIRGVVSYMDGYGTNERIKSEASVVIHNSFKLEWLIKSGSSGRFSKITLGDNDSLIAAGYTLGDDGKSDPLATKINSSGEVEWLNQIKNNGEQSYSGVHQDAEGNILLSASSRGANFLDHTAKGGLDAYIVKLSSDGEVVDSTQVASSTNDWSTNIYIDSDGAIHLTGNTGWYSNLGGNTAIGYHEGFWSKFDSSLSRKSLDFIGTNNNEGIRGVTEVNGEFAFVGEEQLQYDGNTIGVVYISNGSEVNKIAEIGEKSSKAKTRLVELTGYKNDYIYTVGWSNSTIETVSPSGTDALVAKYDLDGKLVWAKLFGANGDDIAWDIDVLPSGNLIVAGEQNGNPLLLELNQQGEVITDYGNELPASSRLHSVEAIGGDRFAVAGALAYDNDSSEGFVASLSRDSSVNPLKRTISLPTDLTAKVGQFIEIPIAINQAQDLQAFDLSFAFDPTLFSAPTSGDLIRGGSLTDGWTVVGNILTSNSTVNISGYAAEPLTSAEGELAYLRLQVNGDAPRGEALLDLVSGSLNENQIQVDLQDGSLTITAPKVSIASDLKVPVGASIGIPISIDDATDLQSIDLVFSYDPTIFSIPSTGDIVTGSDLTSSWTFTANTSNPGEIKISGYGLTPLPAGAGGLINLNLRVNSGVDTGTALLDLVSASFNEGAFTADLIDATLELLPPTFHVMDIRQTASGLALKLSEAPDLEALNLYDGSDASIDQPDLVLTRADGQAVENLSVHWNDSSSELFLLQTDTLTGIATAPNTSDRLAAGDYSLSIAARSNGLISASGGELIDGNTDGITGDDFIYTFTRTTSNNLISIGDTARGAGQTLGLNGADTKGGIAGLPVLISTSSEITELHGTLSYDTTALSDVSLLQGRQLPGNWTLNYQDDGNGTISYSATGDTAVTGEDLELFRFSATVAADVDYGSSTLIQATAASDSDPSLSFETDPSLVVFAYSGDSTGNGGYSSLDASLIQRVVVELDSGFDAFDSYAPMLISDTTGNGGLSSLDASLIQRRVVGLEADSFLQIPDHANLGNSPLI